MMASKNNRYSEPLLCLRCGNEGYAFWEDGRLIKTSERFFLRIRMPPGGEPDVACHTCGAIQKECRHFKPAGRTSPPRGHSSNPTGRRQP